MTTIKIFFPVFLLCFILFKHYTVITVILCIINKPMNKIIKNHVKTIKYLQKIYNTVLIIANAIEFVPVRLAGEELHTS